MNASIKNADKRPGRPDELVGAKIVNAYLDTESIAIAASLANGNVSKGIRLALLHAKTCYNKPEALCSKSARYTGEPEPAQRCR